MKNTLVYTMRILTFPLALLIWLGMMDSDISRPTFKEWKVE